MLPAHPKRRMNFHRQQFGTPRTARQKLFSAPSTSSSAADRFRGMWVMLVLAFAIAMQVHAGSADDWAKMKTIAPKGYVCYRTTGPIQMDGRLDEPAWQHAPWTDDFADIEGDARSRPRLRTRAIFRSKRRVKSIQTLSKAGYGAGAHSTFRSSVTRPSGLRTTGRARNMNGDSDAWCLLTRCCSSRSHGPCFRASASTRTSMIKS